ncbi:MAG: CapA family protein [Candidatus Marinimicrobia bacterium]|nr:CapA family protein [Candidatus Neomarinimicrobiota bacterium]
MKIVFTGDLFLGGDLLSFDGESINVDEFNSADLRVCNLEQGSGDMPNIKNKSTVVAPLKSLNYLLDNKINIVSLANNHIQDKGESGFKKKIEFLNKNNIAYIGAGINEKEASKAIHLGNEYYLLSFCAFGKSYLKKVQLAQSVEYGVNSLTYEKIKASVNKLPENAKAILIFHWGRENVWLPPESDIKLAKKLLELNKVYSIIGMHSHRVQGALKHKGKYAWFSLGNFLFPNFFIKPRTQMFYPKKKPKQYHITKEYHPVFSLTYKIWKWINRISILLVFDTTKSVFKKVFVKQHKYKPFVKELNKSTIFYLELWFSFLSIILYWPRFLYIPFEFIWRKWLILIRYSNMIIFYLFKEGKMLSVLKLFRKK